MGGEVRYCTAEDGVRIAYKVEGEGPPLLLLLPFLESFSLDALVPEHADVARRVAQGRQLIRFDMRGVGLSDRDVPDMSLDALRRDIEAVVRAVGQPRLSLWGSIIGGVRALDYAARYPDTVDRLILHTAFSRISDVFPRQMLENFAALARSNWDLLVKTLADLGGRRNSEDYGLRTAESFRRSTTGETAARLFESGPDVDLTPLLPQVKAATLILHAVDDPVYPLSLGQGLAVAIPDARLVTLSSTASGLIDTSGDVVETMIAFLNEGIETPVPPAPALAAEAGPFRTVLVSDVVGHTEMMQRLGDARGREVLREHERIMRGVLKANGGTEVKTMGDGFMASFGSVTKAVECAIALQRAFAERNQSADESLSIRVGLNAGEPIEEEGDLFGSTVILAARIAAKAEGAEILASDVVRGLCSGKGFLFADRGEFLAKGFEDGVRIFEISWRG